MIIFNRKENQIKISLTREKILFLGYFFLLFSCQSTQEEYDIYDDKSRYDTALENGHLANEGFKRSLNFTVSWLEHADSITGLIPQNFGKDGLCVWNAHNNAADNFPFMVLTAYLLDKSLYENQMKGMLANEKKLTSRINSLPDDYSLCKYQFLRNHIDTAKIVFGSSEYIKDGIIPITEYMGNSPWKDRMIEMLDDLSEIFIVANQVPGEYYGSSVDTEINGELLQVLSRVFWMTGNRSYLEWAMKIADFYLIDREVDLSKVEKLRLRDHGGEIVGGLSELYVTLHFIDSEKKNIYQKPFYEILDRILDVGRNNDGMFFNEINMKTGEVLDSNIADTWGYLYNAYYSVYLVDQKVEYKEVTIQSLQVLNEKYKKYNWEYWGADGYADAIEGALNLYNRENISETKEWIESEIQLMWSLQDSNYRENPEQWMDNGIIEGWHGDGNFARTSIMYSLWKTCDATISPWRNDVIYGAVMQDSSIYIALKAKENWNGKLHLGKLRHRKVFSLPIDYPRINQFPEWYGIEEGKKYLVEINGEEENIYNYGMLENGLDISLSPDAIMKVKITKMD